MFSICVIMAAQILQMVNYQGITKEKKEQLYWNMRTRCYNKNYHKLSPRYKGCTVCKEWLKDKKAFYEWADQNFYKIDGERTVELDKDILIPGNQIYSPDTCIFVPKPINDMFIYAHGKQKNGLPVGVTKIRERYRASTNKLVVDQNGERKNKFIYIGLYDTPEAAYEAYKTHKMAEIICVADGYRDVIPEKLYNAMINWKFD